MKRTPSLPLARLAAGCVAAAAFACLPALAQPDAPPRGERMERPHRGEHRMTEEMRRETRDMSRDMLAMAPSGDPDVDFARMMRRHHEGGIEMARSELRHGRDPRMREKARTMIREQTPEMHELERYIERHGGPAQ